MKYKLIIYIRRPNRIKLEKLESEHDNIFSALSDFKIQRALLGDWIIKYDLIKER